MSGPLILVHGGVGAPRDRDDGCAAAAEAGWAVLARGGDVLEAAIAATLVLEDDERFNAGTGSVLRLDGETIEMDAAVMTSDGRTGAVAAIRDVKNPILAARAVLDSPHVLFAGEGACNLASAMGLAPGHGPTEQARKRFERMIERLGSADEEVRRKLRGAWRSGDWASYWNYSSSIPEIIADGACDTVGVVVRGPEGAEPRYATTNSTGGASPMLLGRVGDSPIVGAGLFAGAAGAVTATGIGEEIIRKVLSKSVYDRIAAGENPQAAAEWGISLYPEEVPIGLVAVGAEACGIADNREMAQAVREV